MTTPFIRHRVKTWHPPIVRRVCEMEVYIEENKQRKIKDYTARRFGADRNEHYRV